MNEKKLTISRRDVLKLTAASAGMAAVNLLPASAPALGADHGVADTPSMAGIRMTVNGEAVELKLDTRTTLLDALRANTSSLLARRKDAITASAVHARPLSTVGVSIRAFPLP